MSSVLAWLPASGWPRLLCDVLWQSTLIAGLGWLAARYLVHQPAARSWLLLVTLTACIVAPLASMAARGSGWTILVGNNVGAEPRAVAGAGTSSTAQDLAEQKMAIKHAPAIVENSASAAAPPQAALPTLADAFGNQTSAAPALTFQSIAFGALGIAWLAASALLSVRLALSCLATWRLLRGTIPCGDESLLSASATAAVRIGLRKPPVLMVSRNVQTPTIFAIGPPRLLIPADHSTRADTGRNIDWTAAFTHELAHVTRGDGWTRLWVEFALIALPLQPFVWLSRRAFHIACEEACDDLAVATGSNPVDLADTLTAWINGNKPTAGLVTIGMSSTKSRTLRLLALRDNPIAQLNRAWRWVGLPLGMLLIAGLAIAQSPAGKQNEPAYPATPVAASHGEVKASKDETESSTPQPDTRGRRVGLPPYVIEAPDVLTITPVQLVPKGTTRVSPLDKVHIEVDDALPKKPISGIFPVDSSGEVVLGPVYGALKISGLTRLEAQETVRKKLAEILKDPQVALIIDETQRETGITGKHRVGPDGRINLGIYGTVYVDGQTVAEARAAVEKKLSDLFVDPKVAVDVSEYKSKFFYTIIGEQIVRSKLDGNETVLDAILGPISGSWDSTKAIFISRPSISGKVQRLEVNWKDVLQGDDTTNYQILPGDRVFVQFKDK